jgi:transposase
MKSKDLRNVVLCKHQSGDHPRKIFRDLDGALSFDTIQRWVKMINITGSIELSTSPGRPRSARSNIAIRKAKLKLKKNQ